MMQPGSWPRISLRSFVVVSSALFCLWAYYHQFSPTKDPLTASTVAAAVATFDKIAHWLWPDESDELRAEVARLKAKCGET